MALPTQVPAALAQVQALIAKAQQRADHAWALAARANPTATSSGSGSSSSVNFADMEAPTVAAGPPTTLTLAHTPLTDACCTVWRGNADGWAMTTAWTRAAAVITLTNQRVDANELFRVSYRY